MKSRSFLIPLLGLGASLLFAGSQSRAQPGKEPAITILGQIVGNGAPLAQARLELRPFLSPYDRGRSMLRDELDPPAAAGALTARDGLFQVAAPASGMWKLVARAPGFAPLEYPLVPLTEETDLPSVELPRDTGLAVTVMDEKGAPVSGARVLASPERPRTVSTPWQPEWEPAERFGVTDASGKLLLPACGGSFRIEVVASGHVAQAVSGVRPPRVAVRLLRGIERRIEVRDSKRRPGREILAWASDFAMPAVLSGEGGWISLALAAASRSQVRLLAANGEHLILDISPPRNPAAPEPVRVTLQPAAAVSGRVIDLLRRSPLAGALVWAGRDFSSFVRTDRTGAYAFVPDPVSLGPLRAAAGGYFEETMPFPPAGASAGPTFALHRKVHLDGMVVDAEGRPVIGVAIRARYDTAAVRLPGQRLRASGGLARSHTAGRFRIDSLVPGVAYTLRFAKAGFAPHLLQVTVPEAGTAAGPLRVVLTSGMVAFGFVRDDQERPVPGAAVELRPVPVGNTAERIRQLRDPDPSLTVRAITNGEGRFELRNVRVGRFELAVTANGFAAARVRGIEVHSGLDRFDAGTILLRPEALVLGRVQDPGGQPLQGAGVRVVPPDPLAEAAASLESLGEPDAVTDASGWFRIAGQRPGDLLKLTIERSGYSTREVPGVAVPTPEPVVVVLKPSSRVAGVVVDGEGRPVAEVSLTALSAKPVVVGGMVVDGGRMIRTRSGTDGSFLFEGIEPGRVEITARRPGWQDGGSDLQVQAGEDLEGVKIVLRRGASLTGRVLAPDGAPIVGAEIGRHAPEQPGTIVLRAPLATSDGDGRYWIDGLAPGPLIVAAHHGAFGRVVRDLALAEGENLLDFQFRQGTTLSGRVVDAAGSPVPGAWVWLRSGVSTAAVPQILSWEDGGFSWEGLAPGTYELQAKKEGIGRSLQPVSVQLGEEPAGEVVLELAATGTIRGRIAGLTLEELAQVQLSLGWAPADTAQVNYDGTYSITDVLPGAWRVVARLPQTGRQAEGEVTVPPDAGEATLDLDFGQGLALNGVVRRNGQPLVSATVQLLGATGSPSSSETDAQGRFTFRGLSPDLYHLEISDFRTGLVHVREIDLQRDEQILLNLTTVTLSGIVLDAETREPLAQVEIALLPAQGGSGGTTRQQIFTGADGTFTFPEVATGLWRLIAGKAGYGFAERVLSLGGGADSQQIELSLRPVAGLAPRQRGNPR